VAKTNNPFPAKVLVESKQNRQQIQDVGLWMYRRVQRHSYAHLSGRGRKLQRALGNHSKSVIHATTPQQTIPN
jgi:hypothetical protein